MSSMNEMDNKQLYNFNEGQTQVFLTARLGDGCIYTTNSGSTVYTSNCKHREYLEFKKQLIGKGTIGYVPKNGYSQTPIYTFYGGAWKELRNIKNMSIKEVVANLDLLGVALWVYDDGSLHKRDMYYALNTQKFSREIQEDVFIPFFKTLGITAKVRTDNSHTRPLYFLGINKYEGAYIVNEILRKFPIDCYSYKLWSSETIQKWSKLQEKLKSTDKELSDRQKAYIWRTL